jgi:hypothetical protein
MVHGHARLRRVQQRGCWLGWYVASAAGPQTRRGLPSPHQTCRDQDPGCDYDPRPGACELRLVTCLNVRQSGLPFCTPPGIAELSVAAPARDGRGAGNRAALSLALTQLVEAADPAAGHVHAPPIGRDRFDLCSRPFPVRVELGALRRASESLIVRGRDASRRGNALHARLRLTCER